MTATQGSGNLWHKFRSSTKSLSSSLSNLSIKGETDGDTVTSTVLHKAMVKFYKNQEPFTGFPGWLGHKEELPDEQKILKKQSHTSSNRISSGFSHIRKASSDNKKSHTRNPSFSNQPEHTSAGMAFHKIYHTDTPSSIPSSQLESHSQPLLNGESMKINSAPVTSNNSTMMMRERLKRQNTKSSLKP